MTGIMKMVSASGTTRCEVSSMDWRARQARAVLSDVCFSRVKHQVRQPGSDGAPRSAPFDIAYDIEPGSGVVNCFLATATLRRSARIFEFQNSESNGDIHDPSYSRSMREH
jgi:hypothetical protein